jgi:3-dehydroquinate synthase
MTAENTASERLRVELGPRSYDIVVGRDLIGAAGLHLRPILARPRVVVIADERVAALHGATLAAALDAANIAHDSIRVPSGEKSKSFAELERLADALLERRVERSTTLIAFGGGVVGDLAGFAASIVLRGLDFIQIPTTLLAQVDSAVGGKTAINTRNGKNLVGSFHQPRLVLADIDLLDSLPRRELLAGYAEVVKYGLIDDAAFFTWLEENGQRLIDGSAPLRRQAVVTSCRSKARVVGADERESGQRALLNLGHTFAHAIEAEASYEGQVLHGEAVAVGMVMAFDLSVRLGLCPSDDAARVRRHLASVGLPTRLDALGGRDWHADRLIHHMHQDKKVKDGQVTFVLVRGIGRTFVAHDVALDEVRRLVDDAIAA